MNLALFDLDHTLIPFDSGMAWTRFLVEAGVLDADAPARYLDFCHAYVAGTLDIRAMHRATVGPLRVHELPALRQWMRQFEQAIAPQLPGETLALVRRHRDAGDLCAIVTATTRFVAEPLARAFGVAQLVATEAQIVDGRLTGEIDGLPCYREHKPVRVAQWLAAHGDTRRAIADFPRSFFYSDSASDLPLLEAVSDPVAVRPDARLLARAEAAGWPVLRY